MPVDALCNTRQVAARAIYARRHGMARQGMAARRRAETLENASAIRACVFAHVACPALDLLRVPSSQDWGAAGSAFHHEKMILRLSPAPWSLVHECDHDSRTESGVRQWIPTRRSGFSPTVL